ncbi:LpqB family beta-propeller domain-containing protein [Longispora sp. NPDC051575]|uniref:LpqB family beta-propeller domain-containing protein n=1 Tax=Longispora sp. NPDC051575 TaxID=3154943 RepID=UPI00343A325D
MRRRFLAVTVAAACVLSGCGVPDSGPAVTYGAERTNTGVDTRQPYKVAVPEGLQAPDQTVSGYLRAANGTPERMKDQVRAFFTQSAQASWQGGSGGVLVVRGRVHPPTQAVGVGAGPYDARVQVTGDVLGVLNNGWLDQSQARTGYSYTYNLISAGTGKGWLIDNPPQGMMLSIEALQNDYDQRPVYYPPNGEERSLVPDLRYVPRSVSVSASARNQLLMGWLLAGPSSYVAGAVNSAVPTNTELVGLPVEDNASSTIIVDLSARADVTERLEAMVAQIAVTLQAKYLEIRINGRTKIRPHDRDAYFYDAWNPAIGRTPRPLMVEGGMVRTVRIPDRPEEQVPALLRGRTNVRWAAGLNATAAYVANDDALWVGRANQSDDTRYNQPIRIPGQAFTSPPAMYKTPGGPKVLIGAGARVYTVDQADPKPDPDQVTISGVPGEGDVTSLSVAPGGKRVAFVRGGRAYAGIFTDATQIRAWQVASQLTGVTSVSWSSEVGFLVSGIGQPVTAGGANSALSQVTYDGAIVEPQFPAQTTRTGPVAAYVGPPRGATLVMEPLVEIEGRIHLVRHPGVPAIAGTSPLYYED